MCKHEGHLCFICILYTQPENNWMQNFMCETKFYDVEFSTCGVLLVVRKL